MLAIKNLVIGVKTFVKLSCIQSFGDGLKPIVINIIIVTNKKLMKLISTFFFALFFPKYSDKISVQKNVDANNIVPKATGSGE